jgi:dipeptidyl aminopeptidase/acylaminoacyl peptidase
MSNPRSPIASRVLIRTGMTAAALALLLPMFAALSDGLVVDGALHAQERYRVPPQQIVDILETPGLPEMHVSPDGGWAALLERPSMLALREIAQPRLHLAGYRLNPRTNGRAASNRAAGEALELVQLRDGRRIRVDLPAGARIDYVTWSPDGRWLAFTNMSDDGYQLWAVRAGETRARRVVDGRLNAAHGAPCRWLDGSHELLCRFVPAGRGMPPERPPVPEAPGIQLSTGEAAPARTFQDLLKDAHDANLFEHYFTAQLAFVDPQAGHVTNVGAPAIIDEFLPSPDGRYIFVSRTVRPFSYIVPDRWRMNDWFPREMEIVDRGGAAVRALATLRLEEDVPVDQVRSGPRGVTWQPGHPAALVWVQDVTGQVAGMQERVYRLATPQDEPAVLMELEDRFSRMVWGSDGRGLITGVDRYPIRAASWTRTWLVDTRPGVAEPRLVIDRSAEERFGDPGTPVVSGGALVQDGDWIYMEGDGITADGERPFLDRLNLRTLRTERLWQSDAARYEVPVALLAANAQSLVIRSESPSDPPNFYRVERRQNRRTALTNQADPAPQLRGVGRRVLTYERADGVRLAGVVYTPAGWDGITPLPTVVWAYPREFVSPDAAAQVPTQDNRFTRFGGASHMFLLLDGYAVFDGPSIAILGGRTANDTYIEQLVSSAQAAVDAVVEAGIADRDRIGVGGSSYGGFMTANLLAHSRLFRAGLARSAAHNRTLTPFGFQNEQRTLWDAPEVYLRMSPFMNAHQIEAPMLLMHGAEDANPGTFPVQSERMFHALKGLGKVSRLVMLNHEDHGYGARESIFHAITEMIDWFDQHVKNAPPPQRTTDGR